MFNGNNIPFLDWNIFGIVHDRDEFEVIDLSNNKIQEISGKAFHKVSNVKRLVLNHNDLLISGQQHHHKRSVLSIGTANVSGRSAPLKKALP